MRSPAMTRGWAAPEQVLGGKVSFQSDQYPVAMMLLGLVKGVMYGEEARVWVPAGGTRLESHKVLRCPGVHIDPDTAPVAGEKIEAWQALLEQCFRFDPSERFPSMGDLADVLQPLAENESLTDDIEVPLSFGRLVIGRDARGEKTPCWLID